MPAPPSDPTLDEDLSDPSVPANDAAPSSGRAVSAVAAAPSSARAVGASAEEDEPPPSGVSPRPVIAALRQFLASREERKGDDWIRRVIIRRLGDDLEPALLADLAQLAHTRALEAKSPPWFLGGIPAWVARCTRRAIADYFRARKDDEDNLQPGVEIGDLAGDRHGPATDWGAREYLITKWLGKQIGDNPRKVATFRLMVEARVVGRSLGELARENHTTESALSNRFNKLQKELAPKVALMDEENSRMFILGLLLFGLGGLGIAMVVLLLRTLAAPPPPLPILPAPSASAQPAPTFDNALPTQPVDTGTPEKPRPQ